jgi:hypothetical protein
MSENTKCRTTDQLMTLNVKYAKAFIVRLLKIILKMNYGSIDITLTFDSVPWHLSLKVKKFIGSYSIDLFYFIRVKNK